MNIPILKFELERVKESVAAMLTDRNGEINNMIIKSLDAQLTEEWVAKQINDAVQDCLKSAIKDMGNNYSLRTVIEDAILEAVSKGISGKKGKGNGAA
jgi:hypothetical protein